MVTVTDVVCPLCGCVCDDITVEVEEKKITKVTGACAIGKSKFLGHERIKSPMIRENGVLKECSYDEAIKKAAELLAKARRPLLYGWSSTVCEADSAGIDLADEIGGVIDNTASVCHGPSLQAVQDVGVPLYTLGQVKNRADLIVYWGSNPTAAHINHMKRYSYISKGYFLPGGRKDRKLAVVDVRETATARLADVFVQVEPGKDFPLFSAIRVALRGYEDLIPDKVAGVPKETIIAVANAIKGSRFVAIFFGMGVTQSGCRQGNIVNAIQTVRAGHMHTKVGISPMRGHYNVNGFNMVCCWKTGYPFSVDFSRGYPWYNPGETSTTDLLGRGECDVVLLIATDPASHLPADAVRHLARVPVIMIDPHHNPSMEFADIVIPAAISGIENEGTVYRMDSVPIRLKKIVETEYMTDEEIIKRILDEVRAIKEKEGG